MPARTDIHSPLNLVTEDYEFVACGWKGSAGHPGYSPLATSHRHLIDEGWRFGENHSSGDCYHCGAHLTYYAILKHLPSHTLVTVGEQCLDNRFERSSAEFHALRKQAELDRKRMRIQARKAEWLAEDPQRQAVYDFCAASVEAGDYGYQGMRGNFVQKIDRYGDTSDRFVAAMVRDMQRTAERTAQRAVEQADATPVVEGRIVITGEVLSVKEQANDFGVREVMTVKDDRGFKVWGTVPSDLSGVERGDRAQFTATVEKSDRDETFGFFKRPTKASWLDTEDDDDSQCAGAC